MHCLKLLYHLQVQCLKKLSSMLSLPDSDIAVSLDLDVSQHYSPQIHGDTNASTITVINIPRPSLGIIMGNTMGKLYYTTPLGAGFYQGFCFCTMVYVLWYTAPPFRSHSGILSILFTLLSTNQSMKSQQCQQCHRD